MNLFFDLDGTLIDISEKYYQIYVEFLQSNNCPLISKKHFWCHKRKKTSLRTLLNSDSLYEKYKPFFYQRIEDPKYLVLDEVFHFSHAVLDSLKQAGHQLYLITLRSQPNHLFQQLDRLHLNKFHEVLTGAPPPFQSENNFLYKISLLKEKSSPNSLIIGDSKADILSGHQCQIGTVAVLSGISNYQHLKTLSPSYIVRDIRTLLGIIRND